MVTLFSILLTLLAAMPATSDARRDSLVLRADSLTAPADSLGSRLPYRLIDRGVLVETGDRAGQVIEPSGLAVDSFGRFVVADAALHRIQRFERDGRLLWQAGTLGSDPGLLRRPGAVAPFGTLGIAVLDVENLRIQIYDLFGHLQGQTIDLSESATGDAVGRVRPVTMCADKGGALYVADADRDRLLAYDFSGRLVREIGGLGSSPGSFRGLSRVAVTPHGGLVTTERGNARLQHLDADGRVIGGWPLRLAKGRGALAVAVDDSGRVAVAGEAENSVQVFTANGTLIAEFAGLARPKALAFASDGSLLVAESAPGRIRRLSLQAVARE